VFLPESDEDRLILTLPGIPGNVFWDEDFQAVHYRIRNRFFRARWKAGAEPEELFPLPFSESVSDTRLNPIPPNVNVRAVPALMFLTKSGSEQKQEMIWWIFSTGSGSGTA
jgi:hypothetical protein